MRSSRLEPFSPIPNLMEQVHARLVDAIADGNTARATKLAADHLTAARRTTLAADNDKTIEARLISHDT